MKSDPGLWARLSDAPIGDSAAAMTFAHRLARETLWPVAYADRAISEYKRFVYLACVSSTDLTPSAAIDEVWHLHLSYSRDYWERFCPEIVGRPLHHGPTSGGAAESARYRKQYGRTLSLYREEFGESPPPDLWPTLAERFGPDAIFVRAPIGLALRPPSWTPLLTGVGLGMAATGLATPYAALLCAVGAAITLAGLVMWNEADRQIHVEGLPDALQPGKTLKTSDSGGCGGAGGCGGCGG